MSYYHDIASRARFRHLSRLLVEVMRSGMQKRRQPVVVKSWQRSCTSAFFGASSPHFTGRQLLLLLAACTSHQHHRPRSGVRHLLAAASPDSARSYFAAIRSVVCTRIRRLQSTRTELYRQCRMLRDTPLRCCDMAHNGAHELAMAGTCSYRKNGSLHCAIWQMLASLIKPIPITDIASGGVSSPPTCIARNRG